MCDVSTLTSNGSMQYDAVICAAGAGTRMGQNKALCQLSPSETFLSSIVHTLTKAGVDKIIVVIGAQAETVQQCHANLDVQWVVNPDWKTTYMLESLTCGIRACSPECGIIHWPVDCVGVHPSDLMRLLAAPQAPFAALSFQGKRGHPLRIAPHKASILRTCSHTFTSLRDFFYSDSCICIEANYPALMNCNDPHRLADFIATQNEM